MMAEREAALSAIGREVRYRDALHKLRADLQRLEGKVTLPGRRIVTREMFATIDRALDIGGEFGGLPEPDPEPPSSERARC